MFPSIGMNCSDPIAPPVRVCTAISWIKVVWYSSPVIVSSPLVPQISVTLVYSSVRSYSNSAGGQLRVPLLSIAIFIPCSWNRYLGTADNLNSSEIRSPLNYFPHQRRHEMFPGDQRTSLNDCLHSQPLHGRHQKMKKMSLLFHLSYFSRITINVMDC